MRKSRYHRDMWKNTPDAYGLIAKSFHWVVALLIIGLLCLGFYMEGLQGPDRGQFYGIHKSFGLMVLMLIVCRFVWRQYTGVPRDNPAHPKWERTLADIVHYALYAAAFLMPLSGWGMSSAGGHPVMFFGLPVPPLVSPDKVLGAYFSAMHSVLAWTIITLVSLHVLGALKHHFIDRDDTLRRMLDKSGKA